MCVCVLVGMCVEGKRSCWCGELPPGWFEPFTRPDPWAHWYEESLLQWRGGAREEEKQLDVREGLVWISVFIKVSYSGLCDGGSLEQTLQFFASICHFKVNVRCTMWWLWSNDSICTFKTHFHNAVLSATGYKTPEKFKFAGDLVNELINSCLVLCWWSSLRIKSCLSISGAKDNTTLKRCGGAEVMCYSSGSVSLSGWFQLIKFGPCFRSHYLYQ